LSVADILSQSAVLYFCISSVIGEGPLYSTLLFSVGAGGLLSTTESPQDISTKLEIVKVMIKAIFFEIAFVDIECFETERFDKEHTTEENEIIIILPYSRHQLQRKHA
jgi:hypothetical protein